jgi:transposase-like protein
MPRGVPHSPELRAQAVAAVLAGGALAEVARRYGVSKGTLGNWLAKQEVGTVGTIGTDNARAREEPARGPEALEDLIFDLVTEHLVTLRAGLQATARPEWLEKQSAADLAELVRTQRDTLLRLLAGFRPAEPAALPTDIISPTIDPAG